MALVSQAGKIIVAGAGLLSLGAAPGVPQNVQLLTQGQTLQEQGIFSGTVPDFTPQNTAITTIGFSSVSGATDYDIWRSVSGGSYAFYDTITDSSASTKYGTYVTNSTTGTAPGGGSGINGPYPYQSNVNRVYVDTAATGCQGYPKGSTPFYDGTGYRYKVLARNGSGSSALSAANYIDYIRNGLLLTCAGTFDNGPDINFGATDGGTTPSGYTTCAKIVTTTGFEFFNLYAGFGTTRYLLNLKTYTSLILNVKAAQTGTVFQFGNEVRPDVAIQSQGTGLQLEVPTSNYGTIPNGSWGTLTIPISDLVTDWTTGSAVVQWTWYKTTFQTTKSSGGETLWFEMYFV